MGFLGGSGKAAAVLVGAFVGFLAVGDSRLWGLGFEAEVTILATFLKVDSTNAFCSIKAILRGMYLKSTEEQVPRAAATAALASMQAHPPPRHRESLSSGNRKRPCALRRV